MEGNGLLNIHADDLADYLRDKYCAEVPELQEDRKSVDHREAERDVSSDPRRMAYHLQHVQPGPVYVKGIEITVEVPFTGDAALFKLRPNTVSSMPPQGTVQDNTLTFQLWGDNLNSQRIRAEIDKWLANIRQHLQWQQDTFKGFNDGLRQLAHQAIEGRRQQLLNNQNLVASLGIPLKRRSDAITTYAAPEVKRRLIPACLDVDSFVNCESAATSIR